MLELIEQLHQDCSSNDFKFGTENNFYIFLTVTSSFLVMIS